MKVKSENEVAQSCPTLPNPMNSGACDFPGKSTGVGCHRLLRSRLVVGSHSAETPLLLTEILICLMLGGREDTRGDGFAFLTYQGSPLELLCCCFILLSPALFIFHPAALTFFFFAMLAQMRKFQVQTMGPFHHCSPAASFQCSPTLLYTPVLIISRILFIS